MTQTRSYLSDGLAWAEVLGHANTPVGEQWLVGVLATSALPGLYVLVLTEDGDDILVDPFGSQEPFGQDTPVHEAIAVAVSLEQLGTLTAAQS